MIATASCHLAGQDCPICAPIYEHIAQAQSADVLLRVERVVIPHAKGISDEQRKDLQRAVRERFSQLNAAAVGPQKGRW